MSQYQYQTIRKFCEGCLALDAQEKSTRNTRIFAAIEAAKTPTQDDPGDREALEVCCEVCLNHGQLEAATAATRKAHLPGTTWYYPTGPLKTCFRLLKKRGNYWEAFEVARILKDRRGQISCIRAFLRNGRLQLAQELAQRISYRLTKSDLRACMTENFGRGCVDDGCKAAAAAKIAPDYSALETYLLELLRKGDLSRAQELAGKANLTLSKEGLMACAEFLLEQDKSYGMGYAAEAATLSGDKDAMKRVREACLRHGMILDALKLYKACGRALDHRVAKRHIDAALATHSFHEVMKAAEYSGVSPDPQVMIDGMRRHLAHESFSWNEKLRAAALAAARRSKNKDVLEVFIERCIVGGWYDEYLEAAEAAGITLDSQAFTVLTQSFLDNGQPKAAFRAAQASGDSKAQALCIEPLLRIREIESALAAAIAADSDAALQPA
ncbi:hypothetical protein JNK13_02685 [bacterium]|nr:hypothetical protein [bacterium]